MHGACFCPVAPRELARMQPDADQGRQSLRVRTRRYERTGCGARWPAYPRRAAGADHVGRQGGQAMDTYEVELEAAEPYGFAVTVPAFPGLLILGPTPD